jgi:hypothetical protein
MSLEAVLWVKNLDYDACALGPYRVLLILAEHANSEGKRAWRSKKKIAETLGVSARSVQRWYADLIGRGLIVVGDQSFVDHIPADSRPVVYDLVMHATPYSITPEFRFEDGETGFSTGGDGETTAVATGETTAVAHRTTLRTNTHLLKTNSPNRARAKAACGHDLVDDRHCGYGCPVTIGATA